MRLLALGFVLLFALPVGAVPPDVVMRTVHDVSRLDLPDMITEGTEEIWTIIEVKADSDRSGTYIKQRLGAATQPGTRVGVKRFAVGSWKPLQDLTGQVQEGERHYKLELKGSGFSARPPAPWAWRPGDSLSTGTYVAQIDKEPPRGDRLPFIHSFQIPKSWVGEVHPALARLRALGEDKKHEAANELQTVRGLFADDNPFVAVAAVRMMIERGLVAPKDVRELLRSWKGYKQAVLVRLLLEDSKPDRSSWLQHEIVQYVRQAGANDMVGVVAGLLATSERSARESINEALEARRASLTDANDKRPVARILLESFREEAKPDQ